MELREYSRILLSRWWLLLLLPVLAGIFGVYQNEQIKLVEIPDPTYMYDLQYSISFLPMVISDIDQDPRLGAVQVSEYVADDLTQIFESTLFASYVELYLEDEDATTAQIAQGIRVAKAHRLVTLVLRAESKKELYPLAEAVKEAIPRHIEPLLNELWGIGQVRLELIDDSGALINPESVHGRPPLEDISDNIALALLAAMALAFGLEYLDNKIRYRHEVERLIAPVLGEIPAEEEPPSALSRLTSRRG
ncbi:MAG: hypothetical protein ACPGWR_14770 [Ardenticatenaceae bacterium]